MGNTYVVDIYAIWDEDLVFTISSNTFYEGKDVGVDDIKKGIRATDFEDGDLTGSIRIVEIRYSSGKRVDGKVLDSYSKYTPVVWVVVTGWIHGLSV